MKTIRFNILVITIVTMQCKGDIVKHVIEETDKTIKGISRVVTGGFLGGIQLGFGGHISSSSEVRSEEPPRHHGLFGLPSLFRPPPSRHHQGQQPGYDARPPYEQMPSNHNHGQHHIGTHHVHNVPDNNGYGGNSDRGTYNEGQYNGGGHSGESYNQGGNNGGGYQGGGYNRPGNHQYNNQENSPYGPTTSGPKLEQPTPQNSNQNGQQGYQSGNNQQNTFNYGGEQPGSHEIAHPASTTEKPQDADKKDKPTLVALTPDQYTYGTDGIKVKEPTVNNDDEFAIDVRTAFDEDQTAEKKHLKT